MQEPSLRTSRLAIAGGLFAVIAVGGGGFLLGRSAQQPPAAPPVAPVEAPVQQEVKAAADDVPDILRRADIIQHAQAAADAFAAGQPFPDRLNALAGRRFELALPFGCTGAHAASASGTSSWAYDADQQSLKISVSPSEWRLRDWGLPEADAEAATVEGFWVSRPWTAAETCPSPTSTAAPESPEPVTLPGQTLAVAQFPDAAEDRGTARDGRAFSVVKRIPADEFTAAKGFVLRIVGRIDRVPGAGPVSCVQPAGIDQRPVCVVAIRADEVRIENPANGDVVGTWPTRG